MLTTLALFGTGVALLLAGPPSDTLIFAHKLSFIAWVALMTVHVLGHLLEVPRAGARRTGGGAGPRRGAPGRGRGCGRSRSAALLAGAALGVLDHLGRRTVALREFSGLV